MKNGAQETDFSSGMLVQLILASFRRQGILEAVLPKEDIHLAGAPRVGLDFKRNLLRTAFNTFGYAPILEAGFDIRLQHDSPMGYTLLKATSVNDLLNRFFRFEKYFHSKHRLAIRSEDEKSITLWHYSKTSVRPEIYEDIVVAGLLAGILDRFGCRDLVLEIEGQPLIARGKVIRDISLPGDCSCFTVRWSTVGPAHIPVFDGQNRFLNSLTAAGMGPVSRKTGSLISSDPVRSWKVEDVAGEFGLSARSLQRRLTEEGTTFSKCVMAARCQCAVYYMTEEIDNLSAVGFLAGFSDAAHFSREFSKTMGILPSDFRINLKSGSEND